MLQHLATRANNQVFIEFEEFKDVVLIAKSIPRDGRGVFRRIYDVQDTRIEPAEISFSHNTHTRTLRGLHYLEESQMEYKVVECVSGSVFDVIVDSRPSSPNYLDYTNIIVSSDSEFAILIPPGFAHGYLTLEDNSSLIYQMSSPYESKFERGLRWNDPSIGIEWPASPKVISDKDSHWKFV
jgi:dTDP-4-dehydrorhamnose 3,5-epimerase